MNKVAIQGRSASGSASTTEAVKAPLTLRAAATSCRKRPLNSGSLANSAVYDLYRELHPRGAPRQVYDTHAARAEA